MAVLKKGATTSLRVAVAPPPPPVDPERAALAAELDRTRAVLAALEASSAADAERARQGVADARAAGIEEGRRTAQALAEERLAVLTDAIAAAQMAWAVRLDELETLAATLARGSLAKLFATPDELGERVARTIARNVAALREAGASALHVHPDLVADLPDHGLAIVADPALPVGGCRVALTLGSADLSLDRQWRAIDALLASQEAPR